MASCGLYRVKRPASSASKLDTMGYGACRRWMLVGAAAFLLQKGKARTSSRTLTAYRLADFFAGRDRPGEVVVSRSFTQP